MKRILLALSIFFVFLYTAPARAAEQVDAEKYIELVRTHNFTILSEVKRVEASYYQVLSSVSYQRLKTSIGTVGSYYTATGVAPGRNYNPLSYGITPTISQVIDISGVNKLNERQSILNYESGRAGFENTVNTLLATAESSYWNVVLARENVSLQKDILRQRQENLRVTEEKFNQQLVPKLDVIRATTLVSDAQNAIVNAEATLLNTLAALQNYAGGVEVEPADETFYVPSLALNSDPSNVVAIEKHPNVKQKRLQLIQSEVSKKIAEKGLAPTLNASAAWDMFSGVSIGSSFETGEANMRLSLNVPLTDGNQTKYDTLNKSTAIEAARESVLGAESDVILALSVARNNWERAKSLETNMKQQVARSGEELKITELMYNEGMGSQLDLITAQTDNQTVRTNYLQAVLGMYTAITDIRKALGDYATNDDGSWKAAVVRYGKGPLPVKLSSAPVVPTTPASSVLSKSDDIVIKVRDRDVTLDEAMEWLKDGKLPSGIETDREPLGIPLYKKAPGAERGERFYPDANLKDVSTEEALEWLKK